MTSLRKAAQKEPVPVAWMHTDPDKPRVKFLEWRQDEPGYRGRWDKTPLYTAPPRCPNCASLESRNAGLDQNLCEMEHALNAADLLMGHDDEQTEWRRRWGYLWAKP